MKNINLTEQELFIKFEKWICDNVEAVKKAQDISKKISDLNLINPNRSLPFEMNPVDENFDDYNLIVFVDHPRYQSINLHVKENEIFFFDEDDKPETKIKMSDSELNEFLNTHSDEDVKTYQEFLDFIEKRNYTEINKIINSELSKYRENINSRLIEIKKYLSSNENTGLTNPKDGTVSYLNRVMGRWDLALLWDDCPFVVISDAEKTQEIISRVDTFRKYEKIESGLIHTLQKSCLISDMDVQVLTDSKENEMDASGWLSLDELGVPQVGPLIHVVKINVLSKLEGNMRKGSKSSNLIF